LISDDADATAPAGTTIRWTASARCPGNSATYQFFMTPPRGFVRNVRAWGPSPTFDWSTAGLAPGSYRFQVWIRRAGATAGFETSASATFTLRRP